MRRQTRNKTENNKMTGTTQKGETHVYEKTRTKGKVSSLCTEHLFYDNKFSEDHLYVDLFYEDQLYDNELNVDHFYEHQFYGDQF